MKWSAGTENQWFRVLLANGDNQDVAQKKVDYIRDNEIYVDMDWNDMYDYILELEVSTFCGHVDERDELVSGTGFDKPCRSCM